ncbi:MAG: gliding motility-associated C-terminal domain-containing protein [Saprospiraceae bacterium]|nr:gliding motility-associated C-terminal domain-containing protein [Candidatus Brachybacter algidus]
MSVYDRYGEEIFTTHDWNIGWNGMDKNGKALPNGNYVVRVHITGPREVSKVLQGTAMLLR